MKSPFSVVFLFVLLTLFLVSGCVQPGSPITEQATCGELEEYGKELLEKANFCNVDSDCTISTEFSCPFGCFKLLNKNADLSRFRNIVELYKNKCRECIYECPLIPTLENIQCKNNKCVVKEPADSIYTIDKSKDIMDEIERAIKSKLGEKE